MNITLSEKEAEIIRTALRNRIEDLTYFSRECERKRQSACMETFIEMANDTQNVLDKFYRD